MTNTRFRHAIDNPGHWRVTTSRGTVHELHTWDILRWRRTPGPDSEADAYDRRFVRLARLGTATVGQPLSLTVADGSLLHGPTQHVTSNVRTIEWVGGRHRPWSRCTHCGNRAPFSFCWRCIIEPEWLTVDTTTDPRLERRFERRHAIEHRLGVIGEALRRHRR